jgi:hypothetical protein
MTMIVPAGDRFRTGMARRVTSNVALRLTATTASHSVGGYSSTGAVGPEMPALLTSTSRPPSDASRSPNITETASRLVMSQTLPVIAAADAVTAETASPSASATCTRAPAATNARVMARPIPPAPPVTRTRWRASAASLTGASWRTALG